MPTELTHAYVVWADPAVWLGVGFLSIFVALIFWRWRNPESFKRAWRGVKNFFHRVHRLLIGLLAFTATIAFLGVYFYTPTSAEVIRSASPEFYNWASDYMRLIHLIFWGMFALTYWLKLVSHGDRQDDGIVNDVDAERRFQRTDTIIGQMELNRRQDTAQMKAALEALTKLTLANQQAFYASGKRFEENPVPPAGIPERRSIVRSDPSIPLTKEEIINAFLPDVQTEETATEGTVPVANDSEDKATTTKDEKPEETITSETKDETPAKAQPFAYTGWGDQWLNKKKGK
ncbi:MAG: hypothetical protein WCT49_02340 [Candidatus Paceibacterota bacterium]|jgi:hypothetical protein|nr:hypothetical protein [Candidatus Paceibacterota bacterium]